jgi:hypothetical protein
MNKGKGTMLKRMHSSLERIRVAFVREKAGEVG